MRNQVKSESLWVVSDDAEFCERVKQALSEELEAIRVVTRGDLGERGFWRAAAPVPAAVLLDSGEDLDWAAGVLRDIKRAHLRAPVIVASRELSKDFGTKIVSEGANYFLLREFEPGELREAATSLIRQARHPSR